MKLSIIIVNRNQCRALRQALNAITEAARHFDCEMIVVDNASADRSVEVLQTEFPAVKLLPSEKLLSYTKAANQGMQAATGEYVLLTEPDTITGEDTLDKALAFMEQHPHAGALTVRNLDAEGNFIPASKNCIPSAWIRFFKFTGLSRLFPKSRLFSRRFKPGWDEEFETTETDVICSNFMLIHRSVLDKTGFFDERFRQYGMDIDLSYRIRLAGFMNYYFAKTFIIHQQTASVNKFSWAYVKNFYGAMIIFAGKYLVRMPEVRLKGLGGWTAPSYEFER